MKPSSSFFKTLALLMSIMLSACTENSPPSSGDAHSDEVTNLSSHKHAAESHVRNTELQSEQHSVSVTRSAKSHSHGNAELAIVLENTLVTIELETPLYNILGFEHAPRTDIQKVNVRQAEKQLKDGGELFTFNPEAKCEIKPTNQNINLFDTVSHNHQKDHDIGHSNHDDHNDHEEESHAQHKDMLLRYEFLCQSPSSLSNVSINLFEFFDKLTEIHTTYLGPSLQKQVTLTRKTAEMDIFK